MFYQVSYDPPDEWPKVSIVIPTTCKLELLRPCLSELLARTTYPNFEVLLAVNEIDLQNDDKAACVKEFAKDPRVRVLVYKDRDFNYSWVINWAAKQASGSILCLMNDDVKIITRDWLEKLVVRLQLNGVGAVGVMLYYPERNNPTRRRYFGDIWRGGPCVQRYGAWISRLLRPRGPGAGSLLRHRRVRRGAARGL